MRLKRRASSRVGSRLVSTVVGLRSRIPLPASAAVLTGLLVAACADGPGGPSRPEEAENTLPELLVSGAGPSPAPAVSASFAGRAADVTYVSLPPGTLPDARSLSIRNVTAGAVAAPFILLVDGGFDPVAVPAAAGDRLELAFTDRTGAIHVEVATVPARRPPTIVRTSPAKGRTDVPLSVQPRVVFSEPVDPGSLAGNVELVRGGAPVPAAVSLVPGEPWTAELDPGSALLPGATYELSVASGIRDLDGEPLDASLTIEFTTGGTSFDVADRIAFVSTRGGGPTVYVLEPAAPRIVRLAAGEEPAWSPDGSRIAFQTPPPGAPKESNLREIHVIDADGSNERRLVGDATSPSWSPDGRLIAFDRDGEIYAVNALTGAGETPLIRREALLAATGLELWAEGPVWSPDGRHLAVTAGGWNWSDFRILIAAADGSTPRPLVFSPPPWLPQMVGYGSPAWSPDGTRLLFGMVGIGMNEGPEVMLSVSMDGKDVRYHGGGAGSPDWSPDGSAIIHYLSAPGCTCVRIYITDVGGYSGPSWLPAATYPQRSTSYSDYDPAWLRPRK